MPNDTITAIAGVSVGHWTQTEGGTGCTVILFDPPVVAGVDVRGSAPGTRETDAIAPVGMIDHIDAVVLTGGSSFGLAAADGAMRWLEALGRGFRTVAGPVPIAPAAVIFDLAVGDASVRPDAAAGYAAAGAAASTPVEQGNVCAGTGAVAGFRARGTKGGLGSATRAAGGALVGALAVVNAGGNVHDPVTGDVIAGTRDDRGGFVIDPVAQPLAENTTLGVVGTNARLDKLGATKVAQMAYDGLARAIRPAHGMGDGDTIFAVSVPADDARADVTLIGHLAAQVLADAILSAVLHADSAYGVPSATELGRRRA